MDAMVEGVAVAIKERLRLVDDRQGWMLKIGPEIDGARLVAIGKAGRWVDAVVPIGLSGTSLVIVVNGLMADLRRHLTESAIA